jgi:hypothetical protein
VRPSPQHHASPFGVSAQVWAFPALIDANRGLPGAVQAPVLRVPQVRYCEIAVLGSASKTTSKWLTVNLMVRPAWSRK